MKKLLSLTCVALVVALTVTVRGNAQAKFLIPERAPDYESYMYFEDCLSAAERVQFMTKRHVEIVDTALYIREPKFLSAISKPAKDTGRICSGRWTLDSVETKFIDRWGGDLMMLGRTEDVRKMYSKYIDSVSGDAQFAARRSVFNLFSKYLDEGLLDDFMELWAEYHKNIPTDSVPLKIFAPAGYVATWIRLWQPRVADSVLNEYIRTVEAIPPEKMRPYFFLTERFYPTVKVVKESAILEKLTESTVKYAEYLNDLWKKIGNLTPLVSPIDSVAPGIVASWWYASKPTGGNLISASRLTGESIRRPVPNKINLIAFVESGCHDLSIRSNRSPVVRQNGEIQGDRAKTNMCARTIAGINRLKEAYPDMEVTIISKTFGSFGNILAGPPEHEAEVFAKYLIEHKKLNAHVAVVESENFRLAGLDNRRIDLPNENEDNYFIANTVNSGHLNVLLVDPEGKIFYSGLIALDDEENIARNLIGAVKKRMQSKTAQF